MALRAVLRIILTFGLLAAGLARCRCIETRNYMKLIKDVHTVYRTRCVFFLQSGTFSDIKVTTLMHNWSREFSKMGVLSTATTFPETAATIHNYAERIGEPLYVVALNGDHTVEEFRNVTGQINGRISAATWFLIFLKVDGRKPHENFCANPRGNTFNLRFDTRMLVLCYDMPLLREWYSLSDNVLRTFDYAIWRPERRHLQLLNDKNMFDRRANMFNQTLRIISLKGSDLIRIENNELRGTFGTIFTELSKALNFSVKILQPRISYGGWNKEKQIWTGVIGQLANNEADIGLGGFTMTNKRLDIVDFTMPLVHSRNRVYIRRPDESAVLWAAYFQAFDLRIWGTLILLLVTSPLILTWMKRNRYHPIIEDQATSTYTVLAESYTRVWGLYCQQGLAEFTIRDSLRLAYLSISVSALIVYCAYSASLISYLTVSVPSMPFTTLEEYVQDGTYKLIVFKDSADMDTFQVPNRSILAKMKTLMKNYSELPYTPAEGFEQICRERTAFYSSESARREMFDRLKCDTVYIETGRTESLAITLTKNSPYTGVINHHLQMFLDKGILDRIRGRYFRRGDNEDNRYRTVGLWSVAPLLAVALGGAILALLVLALERLYSRCERNWWTRPGRLWSRPGSLQVERLSRIKERFGQFDLERTCQFDSEHTYMMQYMSQAFPREKLRYAMPRKERPALTIIVKRGVCNESYRNAALNHS